jgi:carbon-monoxide dehydrogenase small subunit
MTPQTMNITLVVNGQHHSLDVAVHHSLLDVLRNDLDLTGTKECCAEGECGACTVWMDEKAVNACLVLAVEADGRDITTIEGLATEDHLSPVQQAFLEEGAVQCGFCIPGMVMSAAYLLEHNDAPTEEEIREALSGNLCRCAGYKRIVRAVQRAAEAGR